MATYSGSWCSLRGFLGTARPTRACPGRLRHDRHPLVRTPVFRPQRQIGIGGTAVKKPSTKPVRCAIYTRVSTDHGLEQDFNSLDAQYDAAQAYIRSQAHAGWTLIRSRYDDGGYSGGSTERPALQRLLADVKAGKIDVIVVYKVDRLTRSLADFAKLVELFDGHGVSFVSVTQQLRGFEIECSRPLSLHQLTRRTAPIASTS